MPAHIPDPKIALEDLDAAFGPGPTVAKEQILAVIAVHDHRVGRALRVLLRTNQLTDEELQQAAAALRTVAQLANQATASIADAQAILAMLRRAVDARSVVDKAIGILVGSLDPVGLTESTGAATPTDAPSAAPVEAPTLDQLMANPSPTKIELEEDIQLLDNGRVYYASGKPFVGSLSARQLHLLKSCRRLLAPSNTPSMTAGDFVKLIGPL